MRFARLLLAMALACPLPLLAHAATPSPLPPALAPLLVTPAHRAALLHAAQSVNGSDTPSCPSASVTTTGDIGLLSPIQTDAAGHITGGAWKETMQQAGCGLTRLLNAITTVQSDGTLQTDALLPGTTITDPELQRDSVQYAAYGLGQMPEGCEQGAVVDTRFVGQQGKPPGVRPVPR